MGSRLRFVGCQLALLLAVGLVAVGLAEQVARRKYPDLRYEASRQQRAEDLFIRFDSRMGWSNIPGRQARFARKDFDTLVSINEQGFRGDDFSPEKPPHVLRIAVLGDSYVFGHGVEGEETFCAQLERRLQAVLDARGAEPGSENERVSDDWRRVEVLNLGVIGYSTDQELLLLRDRALQFGPDLVVLGIYRNDILDNGRDTAWGLYRKPRFVQTADGLALSSETLSSSVPWSMRLRRELRSRFVLYDIVAFRLGLASVNEGLHDDGTGDPRGAAVRMTQRLLHEFAGTCRQQMVPAVFLVVPPWEEQSILDGLVQDGYGRVLNPEPRFDRFERAHPDSSLGFTYDSHWNRTAHRLVADTLAHTVATILEIATNVGDPGEKE